MATKISKNNNREFILASANRLSSPERIEVAYASYDWKTANKIERYLALKSLCLNKSIPRSVLCDVVLQDSLGDSNRQILLEHENINGDVVASLYSKSPEKIGAQLPGEKDVPESMLEEMSLSANEDIRRAVARNKSTSAELLEFLADDESPRVRANVAINKKTPVHALNRLFETGAGDILHKLARNCSISEELAKKLYNFGLGEQKLRGYVIDGFTSLYWHDTLHSLAKNVCLSIELQELLAIHESDDVRSPLAASSKITYELLEKLSKDVSCSVRQAAASNTKATEDILVRLSVDPNGGVRKAVAQHPNTPASVLHALAADKNSDVRWSVARANNVLPETLEKLLLSTNKEVREAALCNSKVSAKNLHAAISTYKIPKRIVLISMLNFGAPVTELKEELVGANLEARSSVAGHPKVQASIISDLVSDKSLEVVVQALWNPQCPSEVMELSL